MGWIIAIPVLFCVFVLPFVFGTYVAKSMRLPEYGWRIGVILCTILASAVIIFIALQPEQPLLHTVQDDDTLQSIAEQYDLGVKTLTDENNLQGPDDFTVGKELRIPNPKRLEIKTGVDLSGGVILIYEVDEKKSQDARKDDGAPVEGEDEGEGGVDIDALVEALAKRINPGGVKEVVIRRYGDKQVEIIYPDVDDAEVERIKRQIVRAGFLKFHIMAKEADHPRLCSLAQASNDVVVTDGNEDLGEWVPIARTEDGLDLKVQVVPGLNLTRELDPGVVEVLMAYDEFGVQGKDLRSVSKGFDDTMNPAVNFSMTSRGSRLFGGLTSTNLPDSQTGRESRLGIVMDGELISAPTIQSRISDRGQITGRFSDEEVQELVNVLRAGRLPAVLKPEPTTENKIDPLLGADTIRKGSFAIAASLLAVLAFMLVYYRFAGLVACFALLMNLALILALMIIIRGAFTLPGLAGLVLTVGMSVDANVLIFERIREELRRGAALRMAIRNGFGKATSTIVDANITTLITAIVLYVIGTDQLRGFAVTLILGILMSMFTAIFCSRVIFDLAERRRWLKKLTMMQLLDQPQLNLISMRKFAAATSVVLILLGLGAVVARGRGILDIDFLGGTSVQARLKTGMPYSEVWDRLTKPVPNEDGDLEPISDDISLTRVTPEGIPVDTVWKVDTSLDNKARLEEGLLNRFQDESGQSLFVSHFVRYEAPRLIEKEPPPTADDDDAAEADVDAADPPPVINAEVADPNAEFDTPLTSDSDVEDGDEADAESASDSDGDAGTEAESTESNPAADDAPPEPGAKDQSRNDLPPDNMLAFANDGLLVAQAPDRDDEVADNVPSSVPDSDTSSDNAPPEDTSTAEASDNGGDEDSTVQIVAGTTLIFDERVTRETLLESFQAAAETVGSVPSVRLTGPQGQADAAGGFREWTVEANTTPENLGRVLDEMSQTLESIPAWLSSSKIGGTVAGDTQNQALAAILVSLVFIVGYIWIRFQRVVFGLSAVVALVHDVLITLGAIAVSLWLAKVLGVLLIDEFKISLPVVAAFLTIIGYSLNDTIVLFDRVREVRGKSPDITEEIINTSINQTLSRTVLTSLTTLLVVTILYCFGGQGIHGFAFALLIGVVVGTYSSIFVASPALLWMSQWQQQASNKQKKGVQKSATS